MSRVVQSKKWAWRLLLGLIFVAVFGDFLANDRPIVAHYNGDLRWPVIHQYGEMLGWVKPYDDLPGRSWDRAETGFAIWPLIPYNAERINTRSGRFKPPFTRTSDGGWHSTHWLGTDQYSRDITASLIRGSRVSLGIGMGAMLIALLIGLILGSLAGYFSDDGLQVRRSKWLGSLVGFSLALLYCIASWWPFSDHWWWGWRLLSSLLLIGLMMLLAQRLLSWLPWSWIQKRVSVPVDALLLRLIELFTSIPALVLLIAILGIVERPSFWWVLLLIGILRWTGIARFLRAELLRIRQLPYIESARVMGFSDWRILRFHALPNAWGPVIVALSFGIGIAILLEAYLSFLGIGLPLDSVSWGSLLRQARAKPEAWWVAVFPGLLIFITVLCCNVLGDRFSRQRRF